MEDSFSTDGFGQGVGGGGDGSVGNASDGERQMKFLIARLPLTSCSADWYWYVARGLGTPVL